MVDQRMIDSHELQSFDLGGGQQQSVERVPRRGDWKSLSNNVPDSQSDRGHALFLQRTGHVGESDARGQLSKPDLDGDLPIRSRTDEDLVRGVLNERLGGTAQLLISLDLPVESVRIEEQSHGMYSAKSFK